MLETAERSPANPPPLVDGLRSAAALLITEAITTGDLRHPNRPNTPLVMPGLRTEGHPDPQVVDAINQLATHLGEALINTVLKGLDAELIHTADLKELRTAAANTTPHLITLKCKHRDLLKIDVKPGTDTADINCTRLRTHLTECETT